MTIDEKFMQIALNESKKAFLKEEVPIGAVIVLDGKVLAKAYNKRNKSGIATHHAEVLAIEKACRKIKDFRLQNAEIYVTLEPCPMCAGAIVNARLKRLIFGAYDKSGKKDLLVDILSDTRLNHKTEFVGGIMQNECSKILTDFFRKKH